MNSEPAAVDVVAIRLHATPPSFNALGYRQAHWRVMRRTKQAWANDMILLLRHAKLPSPLAFVRAEATLRFPQKRRRDEGNFRVLLEKALGDALTTGGWLADDDASRFSFGRVQFDDDRGPAQTVIRVYYEVEEHGSPARHVQPHCA